MFELYDVDVVGVIDLFPFTKDLIFLIPNAITLINIRIVTIIEHSNTEITSNE